MIKKTVLVLALAAGVSLAAAETVAGTWTVSVEGGPHGNATMGLVMKQDGAAISATFATGHADLPMTGKFKDGALELESVSSGDSKIILSARLKDDGTLAGYISSPMGDMKLTARRAADKKDK